MQSSIKKAVIYCRVSTKEQVEEGNSLATQERNCKDYALKNGYDVIATYIEQGESAKTADRTELQKMLSFCSVKKNGVSAVIAYKIDRISRNTDDYSQIRIFLKKYGVEIKSTSEFFEDTPAGRFMENIIANVAQFDNDVRAERSVGGMVDAIREGRYVWQAPYGYSNVKINGKSTIKQNKFAPFVKAAFEEVALGIHPVLEIHRRLTTQGMINSQGKPLSKTCFYSTLRKEIYTGWIDQFGERHKGSFDAIISESLFQRVQKILSGRRHSIHCKNNPDFPLTKFFRHPSGFAISGSWSKGRYQRYPYYLVHHQKINLRKEALENHFKEILGHLKMSIDYFEKVRNLVLTQNKPKKAQSDFDKPKIEKDIAILEEKKSLILEKNLNGVINDAFCREQLQKIDFQIQNMPKEIKEPEEQNHNFPELLTKVRSIFLNPVKTWEEAEIDQKILLQWFYFPKGIEFDGNESRTANICRIFKDKISIFPYKFSKVTHSNSKSNTSNTQISRTRKRHSTLSSARRGNRAGNTSPAVPDIAAIKEQVVSLANILDKPSFPW